MRTCLVSLASLLALASFASPAAAVWTPFAVVQGPGTQYQPHCASDGATGAIVVWYDDRGGAGAVYAQHVLASDGVDPAWPVNGLFIGATDYEEILVSDGAGGAIVGRLSGSTLYADHVLASGALDPAWPAGGVSVCTSTFRDIRAVADGAGGAIFAWVDTRNADRDVFAQRVRSTGVVDPGWPANGVGVCTATGDQEEAVAVSDGSGGIIVAWSDYRNGTDADVFAQRLLPTGLVATGWTAGGVQLCSVTGDQTAPHICSDAAGGAIVAWADLRSGNDYDIYAMRIRSTGALANGWHNNGEAICDATSNQEPFDMIADGLGGAIVSWYDFRAGDGYSDIYAQKMSGSGSRSWVANGVALCTAPNYQVSPSLGSDGSGGAYLAWNDRRYDTTNSVTELFIHHVLSGGSPDASWPANGGRITFDGLVRFGGNFEQPILATGSGNAIVFWAGEANTGHEDVYAMDFNATWTPHYPLVTAVTPGGAGTVTRNPDAASYPSGALVTLTAVPAMGHTFIAWSGDASGSTNPVQVTMNAAKSVTAVFDGYAVNLTISPSGTGTITKSPDQSLYPPGTQVTLTANPGGGYQFTNWTGDATGTSNPVVIAVGNGPASVTANFSLAPPSCGNWSLVSSAAMPPARVGPSMVWDPVRHRVLMFGGYDGTNYLNDLWQYTWASGWAKITPAGVAPTPRDYAGLIYDPVRDRLLVVQGNADVPPTDVVALSLPGTPTWSAVSPVGGPPPGKFAFSAVYDPIRDRVLRFGGHPETNDLWSLSLAGTPTWTKLAPAGPLPTARYAHVAIYDPVRDRMVIHGGKYSISPLSETDALDLPSLTWSYMTTDPAIRGPGIWEGAAVYDPIRDRMLLIAGNGLFGSGAEVGAVSSLSLEVTPFWTRLPVGGLPLVWRYFHAAVYEPDSDLVMIFGGNAPPGIVSDPRRLDCAGGWWLQTAGVNGTVTAYPSKVCYANGDPVTLQAVGSGSYGFQQWLGDASGTNPLLDLSMNADKTIFAQFQYSSVGVDEAPPTFALQPIRPNPNSGPVQVTYELAREARVKLGIYDLAGRLVGRLVDGRETAGRHTATWDTRASGMSVISGIYFVRFETPVGTWTRRVALLR